ncbi:hypothetical protein BCR36DRAFT_407780 [Piromyces finnis]|uniref:Trichohyalin-plectin-homology domain-containing protein n=1 Tax=Piromyces finnis TaxID=1754191 RepID=A0A1Y1VMW5_9FUNG|nr:hypothetical protein BCR36DRAFT_407780 [Piromyces finnis]|eukprot:ORX60774.1 hypothetical protein BCR36DRAFT_407780 [Piromyces finnis]
MNENYIPYNAKLSQEETKELFLNNDSKPYNIISLNDYNSILKSFNEKNDKEEYLRKRAQEREDLRLKGKKLTEKIKSKSNGLLSIHEQMKERKLKKERERQRIDMEWKKLLEAENEEKLRKIKEKRFNTRRDVIEFNKKIQESNILYERKLQIELKRRKQDIINRMDKEIERKQMQDINNNIFLKKMEENIKKLKSIDAGKQLKEQIIKNKELKRQMKKKEDEEILNSKGLVFSQENIEEKNESVRKLYEDIDKQVQEKQLLKKQYLEKEKQYDKEVLDFNNNKSYIQERIKDIKRNEINIRVKNSQLVGKCLKSEREELIKKFCEINTKKEPLFTDKHDIELRNKFMRNCIEVNDYHAKQIEETKRLREKEKEENTQFYKEKFLREYKQLKEEEEKNIEKEKLANLEQTRINRQLAEEKKKRDLDIKNNALVKKLEEEKKMEDKEFNDYVLECINELEMRGRDTRNLYRSLKVESPIIKKEDENNDLLPDTFRRLGMNVVHENNK